MYGQKKGVSSVVATVLVLLIVIATIGILIAFLLPTLRSSLFDSTSERVDLNIETTKGYTTWDDDSNCIGIQLSRGDDDAELTGIQVVAYNGEISITNYTYFPPEPAPSINSNRVYTFCYPPSFGRPVRVGVAPIIKGKVKKTTSETDDIKDGIVTGGGDTPGGPGGPGGPGTTATDCLGDSDGDNWWEICTCVDLNNVRNDLNRNYILLYDIDFSESHCDPYTQNEGWEPIGTSVSPFTGEFNGDNLVIKDLFINRPAGLEQGLFGGANGITISDLNLDNVDITGGARVGGLIGEFRGTTQNYISNVNVSGSITATLSAPSEGDGTGGLIGDTEKLELTDSHSSANVQGIDDVGGLTGDFDSGSSMLRSSSSGTVNGSVNVGGLIGYLTDTSDISQSYATGAVTGINRTGGLVGYAYGTSTNHIVITDSYATGNVKGLTHSIGGLVGDGRYSDILNSYSTTRVETQQALVGGSNWEFAGGLVGIFHDDGHINNSFTTSEVYCIVCKSVGGFVGHFSGGGGHNTSVYNSYWYDQPSDDVFEPHDQDSGASALPISKEYTEINSSNGGIEYFHNTLAINPPMNSWDSTNIWENTATYPVLK